MNLAWNRRRKKQPAWSPAPFFNNGLWFPDYPLKVRITINTTAVTMDNVRGEIGWSDGINGRWVMRSGSFPGGGSAKDKGVFFLVLPLVGWVGVFSPLAG